MIITTRQLLLLLITLASIFILPGCVPIYQEPPANAPKAIIHFNDEPHLGLINGGGIYGNPITCQNLNGIKRQKMFEGSQVSVPANQLLTIEYVHSKYLGIAPSLPISYDYNACSYIVSFIPKKNKSYSIEVTEGAEINNKRSCDFAIYDVTSTQQKIPVKHVIREQSISSGAIASLPDQCSDTHQFLTKLK